MAHRWAVVIVCVVVVAATVPIFRTLGVNFVPDEDESRFQVSVRLPVGSSLAATQSLLDRVARDLREQLPGVSDTLAITGFGGAGGMANQGTVFARLIPADSRPTQQALVARARRLVQPYRREAVIGVQAASGISGIGGRGAAIQYALVGPRPGEARSVHASAPSRSSTRTRSSWTPIAAMRPAVLSCAWRSIAPARPTWASARRKCQRR